MAFQTLGAEYERQLTTVDHSDIRGSEPPDMSSSWSYLSLRSRVDPVVRGPHRALEDSPAGPSYSVSRVRCYGADSFVLTNSITRVIHGHAHALHELGRGGG